VVEWHKDNQRPSSMPMLKRETSKCSRWETAVPYPSPTPGQSRAKATSVVTAVIRLFAAADRGFGSKWTISYAIDSKII
jgi:hypothetical protein